VVLIGSVCGTDGTAFATVAIVLVVKVQLMVIVAWSSVQAAAQAAVVDIFGRRPAAWTIRVDIVVVTRDVTLLAA